MILRELLTGCRPGDDVATGAISRDLEAIVHTAAAPVAAARYPSVGALGEDVARHLAQQPVTARGGDAFYRARRFLARHRLAVLAAAFATVSLAGGLSLALLQARRADAERDTARLAAVNATEVSEFLTRLLSLADPNATLGATVTVAAAIDSAAAWLERDLAGAPEAHAALALVLANLYGATGNVIEHERMADSALAMQERLWGPEDPRLARTLGVVAESRWNAGELAGSESLLRRMIALASHDTVLGPSTVVHGRNLLAISLRDQGRLAEADGVLRATLADRAWLEEHYPVGLDHTRTGLGHIALAADRPVDASVFYREVLARRRRSLGPSHPEVANALINLARALGRTGAYAESFLLFEDGLSMRRVTQGSDHAEIGVDLVGLGDVQRLAGDLSGAMVSYRDAFARLERTHGATHPLTQEVAGKLPTR